MPLLELNIEAAWAAKQTAKGSPATTADKRFRKVGGDMNVNRDDGNENYSDGERFTNAVSFVNTIIGNGNPATQGQASTTGYLSYLMLGQETATTVAAGLIEHVATPAAGSFWTTWWKKVGGTQVLRQKFNDCRITSLRIEGSSASKVLHVTPTFFSLDSGEIFTTDPVKVEDTGIPFLFTEAEGAILIDGVVHRGQSSFAVVVTDALTPWYGDAVTPFDISSGQGQVTIEGITLALDAQGLQRYYSQIYGTTAPVLGQKPIRVRPVTGSYTWNATRGVWTSAVFGGTVSGGTYTLTYGAQTTTAIAYNAAAAVVQTALEALSTVEPGDVVVTGGPGPTAIQVNFKTGSTALTGSGASLTGTAPTLTMTPQGAAETVKVELPSVEWTSDMAIAGNPDGGAGEITLAGTTRKVGANPHIRITTRSSDAAYT